MRLQTRLENRSGKKVCRLADSLSLGPLDRHPL
jgi:hypothetical protein